MFTNTLCVSAGARRISAIVCCGPKDKATLVFLKTTRATLSSANTAKSAPFWPSLPVYASLNHSAAYWKSSATAVGTWIGWFAQPWCQVWGCAWINGCLKGMMQFEYFCEICKLCKKYFVNKIYVENVFAVFLSQNTKVFHMQITCPL